MRTYICYRTDLVRFEHLRYEGHHGELFPDDGEPCPACKGRANHPFMILEEDVTLDKVGPHGCDTCKKD